MIDFGNTLKAAREAKGLTIAQIAETTHIMSSMVRDLENENFTRIAAPIYGRGFVKLYCEAVGLDAKTMVAEFMDIYSGNREPGIRERIADPVRTEEPLPRAVTPEPPAPAEPAPEPPAPAEPETEAPPITAAEPPAASIGALPSKTLPQPDLFSAFEEPETPEPPAAEPVSEEPPPAPAAASPQPAESPSVLASRTEIPLPEPFDEKPEGPVLSRYATPMRDPEPETPKLSPVIVRWAALAAVAVALLWIIFLGVRALYSATAPKKEPAAKAPAAVVTKTPVAPKQSETAKQDAKAPQAAPRPARKPIAVPPLYID